MEGKMKRCIIIILLIFSFLFTNIALSQAKSRKKLKTKLKITGGEIVLNYVDAQAEATSSFGAFSLGTVADDPDTSHSFLTLQGIVNKDVSGVIKLDLTSNYSAPDHLEEAYIKAKNLPGLKDTKLKVGKFYVPFGLGEWDAQKNLLSQSTTDFGNYKTDMGIQFSGKWTETNYEFAYVNGEEDNAKDVYLRLGYVYRDVPTYLSYYRGKEKNTTLSATSISATYNLNPIYNLSSEYIWSKKGDDKTNLFYVKSEYNFNEQVLGVLKYYEINPKDKKSGKTWVIGLEFKEYLQNVNLKAEYIVNQNTYLVNNSDAKDNLIKLEMKFLFK
jgi:hypothetical protein